MAERRMFAKSVVQSDAFLYLPMSAQALYLQISVIADDDGFTNSVKRTMRMMNAADEDFTFLVNAGFLIDFGNGVVAVSHWLLNNYLRNDRYHPTIFRQEFGRLCEINGIYYLRDEVSQDVTPAESDGIPTVDKRYTSGIPNGNQRYTQYSIGKDSIDKESIGEGRTEKERIDKVREEEERLGVRGKGNKATQFASLNSSSPSIDEFTYPNLSATLPSL